ncbi:MAG: carbohydrate-binding protein [Saprospiraceae bacterium]|nr:carbohydrate-binding protein [Saprospiraceae bacterium]
MKKIHQLLSLCLIALPFVLVAQIVPVGSGSYTTQLPPADAAGRNKNPSGTPRLSGIAASKPVPTSDWWTGLLTYDGANLYNYPLSMRGNNNGLVVSYTFLGNGVNDTRQPMSAEQPLLVGVSGLSNTFPTVSDYSDWTVTAAWNSGGRSFSATMGMGMPFVYCTKGSADTASVTINSGTVLVQNEMILVTNAISGANFAVYAPVGSTWTKSGSVYTSTLNNKNYFSVAMLPQGVAAATAANDFKEYAYVFPTNTTVSWTYDNATSVVKTTFTVTPDRKEGTGTNVLLGLLPHQWAHLGAASGQPGAYSYRTSRGTMKMLAANTFVVENKFKGILSTLPNTGKYSENFDLSALNRKVDLLKGTSLDLWTDSYNEGLAMNRLIQVARIADQIKNTEARDKIINTVKVRLENWFKATPSENAFVFMYNSLWTTLIGYPAGHSADANLNDHHFHYGYFINAATAVEQFQPGWAAQWGGMVNLLIKDAANWEKSDAQFPFLRHFNPYAGHSFATGLLNNEPHGNNQESSSEAMNFNAALINWGQLTGNTAIRDLGIYLYTTEQTGIEEYWLDMQRRNFSPNYGHKLCSRVWGNGVDAATFWTADIAATYGIELFPMTGASLYLGHHQTYATALWNEMKTRTTILTPPTLNPNLWSDIYWSFLALTDPKSAVNLYDAYPNYPVKFGCSDAHTYHWLHGLNGAGIIDTTITANHPMAVVFNKAGDKTYVAHNYGSSAVTVTYSDGFTMNVPARTLKTSKDVAVSGKLTASATQVATNGSVNLSLSTTGTGITKVEFYDGNTLVATTMTTPYSAVVTNLTAKVHDFYAKIYVGTNFELSNIVSVISGEQKAYNNAIISIPSQTLEAGNYDYYEGGIGQNIAYFDASTTNEAGAFRAPEYVDAGPTANEGNTVGWIDNGEWLEYTVNVAQAGTYDLSIRYASGNTAGGGPFRIEVDGNTVSGNITVGSTGNWNTWASKAVTGVILPAGQHIMRLAFDNGGFNIGRISFTRTGNAEPALSLSATTLTLPMIVNATQTFNVTSNVSWTATSNQNWLTVSDLTGFGSKTVRVTAQENTTTAARTAVVTVSGVGVATQTVTVTQEAGGFSYLLTSANALTINSTANSVQIFDITANVGWTATSDQSWLAINNASGTGSARLTLTAQANTATTERTARVTVTGAGLAPKIVTITQSAAPLVLSLPIDFELVGTYGFIDFDGGAASVIANPRPTGINTSPKIAQIVRNAGATWAGSKLILPNRLDFANGSTFTMKVYSPKVGLPVLFKLEGNASTEILTKTTVANAWEELRWNFAGRPSNTYNALVFMFDFGTVGDGSANSTFWFDDVNLVGTTSAQDLDDSKISIFPNPANDILFINGLLTKSDVSIHDISGKMLLNQQVSIGQIDISRLPSGLYFIKIGTPTSTVTKRFVKQ